MSEGRNFPTINLTDFIIVRKTDEQYTKDLIKYWKEGGMTKFTVSLNCPISKTRLEMPCRGEDCTHIQCFDGMNFLKMNEKQFGKWLCNICQKPSPLNTLFVDGLFLDILKTVSDDVENIYFDMDGNWTDFNPDSKTSKLDYSVIDLSETLEVIDLTGSDDDKDDDDEDDHDDDNENKSPGTSTTLSPKQLDNADKVDKNKTTPGNSENGSNVNTAWKLAPSKKQEVSSKTEETNGKKNDKGKSDQKGKRNKEGDNNKENSILPWYRGLNTNYHAIRNQRYNNKTLGLPYARRYPERKNNSSNAFYSTQRQGFRKPLHQHNPYCNVDYSVPFCQQTMLSWFSGNVTSLDFGNRGNFSIRIEL